MKRRVIIPDDAFRDLDEASANIGDFSPQASVRFLEEAQNAFALLVEMPGIGILRDYRVPALSGMRMWPVPHFRKYLIFYLTHPDRIEIVRVLHGAQNIQAIFSTEHES